jgi:hypothetical protein
MKKQQLFKKRQSVKRGQGLVEFALILPILLLFMMAIIDLGYALISYSQLTDATRVAVRHGMTKGIEGGVQYLDCDGIAGAARDLPGVTNLSNATVTIIYKDSAGTEIGSCVGGIAQDTGGDPMTAGNFGGGEILEVEVEGDLSPITPFFTDLLTITLSHTSRRTIVVDGAAYTEVWPDPPSDTPTGFTAITACTDDDGLGNANVSFTWDPFTLGANERVDIRDAYSGVALVIASSDPAASANVIDPASGLCTNCATVPVPATTSKEGGAYYMVIVWVSPPHLMAGESTNTEHVICDDEAGFVVSGKVWRETKAQDGVREHPAEPYSNNATVLLTGTAGEGPYGPVDVDNQGDYEIWSVLPGTYVVSVVDPDDGGTYHVNPVGLTITITSADVILDLPLVSP